MDNVTDGCARVNLSGVKCLRSPHVDWCHDFGDGLGSRRGTATQIYTAEQAAQMRDRAEIEKLGEQLSNDVEVNGDNLNPDNSGDWWIFCHRCGLKSGKGITSEVSAWRTAVEHDSHDCRR